MTNRTLNATKLPSLAWPLMLNNITPADFKVMTDFLDQGPILTQSKQVRAFEKEWSE